jgi:hypothetical protein
MKCWNSTFNAQGSRLIVVVVQLGASENICSSNGGAQEKGKTGWNSVYYQNWWFSGFHPPLETQFTTKIDGFLGFIPLLKLSLLPKLMVFWVSSPPWMLVYFFAGFFFNLTLCMTKLRVEFWWWSVFLTSRITLLSLQLCDATRKKDRYQELMKNFYPLPQPPPKCKFGSLFLVFCGFGSLQLSRCHTCHNTDLPSDPKLIGRILQHWRYTVAILMSILLLPAGPWEKAVTNPQVSTHCMYPKVDLGLLYLKLCM